MKSSTSFLLLLVLLTGFSSCCRSRYGHLNWRSADLEYHQTLKKTAAVTEMKSSTPDPKGDTLALENTYAFSNDAIRNTAESPGEKVHRTKENPLPENTTSSAVIASEKGIRAKGFLSIMTGAVAGAAVVTGVVAALFNGFAWGLLLILGGLLFAYFGIQLALSAKKDIDTLTSRSTIAWLNRPATVGFVVNVVVLILCGFVTLFLLMALL